MTILVVGHGTRYAGGNRESDLFVAQWQAQYPDWRIELCYIEFADTLLEKGLDNAACESERVVVLPLILNAAGHVKLEIPEAIAAARLRHPQTEFVYARHLGVNDTMLTIMNRQINTVMQRLDHPDPHTTGVIVLGRGSSDRVANGEVAKLTRWIYETNDFLRVDSAFTGVTLPRLEAVVQQQVRLGMTQIIIQPFYLFAGRLIERIERQLDHLKCQYPHIRFGLGDRFGFAPELFDTLTQRVEQAGTDAAGMMECDGCPAREATTSAHHYHH